jgi:hypothetical protein
MANSKIMSLFSIPITRFPYISYLSTVPWAIPFPTPCFKFILSYKHKSEEGEGGPPRPDTREGEASGGACIGCNGTLSEWCHGGGQWLRELAGRKRDDHGPTLEMVRPAVEVTVTAGGASDGWASCTGGARAGDGGGVRARWQAGRAVAVEGDTGGGAEARGRRRQREGAVAGRRRWLQRWWAARAGTSALCVRVWLSAGVRVWPGRARCLDRISYLRRLKRAMVNKILSMWADHRPS